MKLAKVVAVVGFGVVVSAIMPTSTAVANNPVDGVPPACKECFERKRVEEGCTASYKGDPKWASFGTLSVFRNDLVHLAWILTDTGLLNRQTDFWYLRGLPPHGLWQHYQ